MQGKIKNSLKTLWPVVLTACSAGVEKSAHEVPAQDKPNVIVILTDDQGYGQLNFDPQAYTKEQMEQTTVTNRYTTQAAAACKAAQTAMPNVCTLAQEGVRFTNAFVASTTSAPSRAALLTSKYTQRFGIYNNYDAEAGVKPEEQFLPEVFQKNGYHTAMIGKWHLGELTIDSMAVETRDYHRNAIYGCVKSQHPLNKGFDYYFGFNYHGSNYYNASSLFRNYEHVDSQGYTTDEFTDEALNYIEENKTNPFFIFLSYNAPHIPLEERAPRKYQKFNTGNKEVDNYYATLAAVDDGVGKIMEKLNKLGIADNTIIYFLSDNGAVVDSPLPLNGPFKGNKGLMFQGGIHIPMIAWNPARFPKGKVIKDNVSAMDILPTSLAAAGIKLPEGIDGVDLTPTIQGKSNTPHPQMFWAGTQAYHWSDVNLKFWANYEQYVRGSQTITQVPSSKYKEYLSDPAGTVLEGNFMMHYYPVGNRYELYDISQDPSEENNLSGKYPEKVKAMKADFDKWILSMDEPVAWKKSTWKKLLPKNK